MKTGYSLLLVLMAAAAILVMLNPCWAQQPVQQVPADTNAQQALADTNKPALPAPAFEPNVTHDMNYGRTKSREDLQGRRRYRTRAEVPFAPAGEAGEHERRPPAMMRQTYEEYLQWLQNNCPDEAKELAELKEQNPQLYMRKLALSFKTYGKIAEVARENPELAEVLKEDLGLRKQTDKLLGRIKAAADEEKKQQLVKELEEVTNARFDLIVKRTQIQYEQLNKKLEQLKEGVKENAAKVEKWKDPEFKKQSVKTRMEELLSEAEKFNWE